MLITVVENPVINQVAFEGNREADKDDADAPRSSSSRARCSPAPARRRTCSASSTSTGGRGGLPPSVDPKIIELDSNRVNVVFEINEGGGDQGQGHQFHRQSRVLRQPAARHHHHHPVGPVRLHQGHQHLRPRPACARSRAAQAVLPEERLCRCAHRLRRRRARSRRLGVLHHLRRRRRRAVQVRHGRHRSRRCPGSMPERCDGELLTVVRGDLRPVADGQVGGAADARRLRAGLRLRPRASARGARSRRARDQRHLRDRRGPAHLHRAHQHHRQRAHARLRHPARVPPGGRRRLQSADGRQGQEAPAGAGLLQDGGDQAPAGLGARPRHSGCRGGRAVDRRAVVRCRLFDQ